MKISVSLSLMLICTQVAINNALLRGDTSSKSLKRNARRSIRSSHRALKSKGSKGSSSSDGDDDYAADDEQRTDTTGDCCSAQVSSFPAYDGCNSAAECQNLGTGATCRLVESTLTGYSFKTCASAGNYLTSPRVCEANETPCDLDLEDDLFRTDDGGSDDANLLDDDLFRTDDGNTDVVSDSPTATPINCVPSGVSSYVKQNVVGWQEGVVQGDDECICNDPGCACAGSCKAYLWNVCDQNDQYPEGVKLLCTTNGNASN